MYYEERVIDGKLMFRNSPDGEWYGVTYEALTNRVVAAEAREKALEHQLSVRPEAAAPDDGGITQALVKMARESAIEECAARWIPVSERLPDCKGVYLVADAHGYVTQAWIETSPVDGKMHFNWPRVAHWMPLPSAPLPQPHYAYEAWPHTHHEYDGAFKCSCGRTWGAISNPTGRCAGCERDAAGGAPKGT